MILDASIKGTMRIKNEDKVKYLIERMCQNKYCSQSKKGVKKEEKKKGVLELDTNITLLT